MPIRFRTTQLFASSILVIGARTQGSGSFRVTTTSFKRDWETFSSSQGNMIDELPGRAGATLGTTDPPRHDRLRALSQAAFMRKNIQHLITPTLEIADRALDPVLESGQLEFINDYSSQITVGLLFRTMGLPARDHADIRSKVILAVSTDKSVKGRNPKHIAAFKYLRSSLLPRLS